HRQRLIAEYLLTTLYQAKPAELVSLQRSRPPGQSAPTGGAGSRQAQAPGTATPESDFFAIDPRFSASVTGFVETTAFKITFTGYSSALRNFLNQIAGFELPLVVRSVEVDP